MKIYILNT